MELLTNDWNVLTKKILKAVETANRFFLAQVTSRKTAGLMALRASRLKAAIIIHPVHQPAVKGLVEDPIHPGLKPVMQAR